MKASDISDEAFLDAVDWLVRTKGSAMQWDLPHVLAGHPERIETYRAYEDEIPGKVILAKARKLIRRGLMRGCACGCRGDFVRQSPRKAV